MQPQKPFKIPESVLVVIHTPALEVLVIERADRVGFWQSVTGSKDRLDEALVETARREVFEETGIVIGADVGTGTGMDMDMDMDMGMGASRSPRAVASNVVAADALTDWQYTIEYEIYPVWRHRYAAGVVHNREHWFSLCVPHRVDVTLAPDEHVAYAWLPYKAAAERCFSSSNRDAILQLPARFSLPR
jgi:dATP pyrophosphohydrolase